MGTCIAVIYNQPEICRYHAAGEAAAVEGVLEEVEAVAAVLQDLGYIVKRVPLAFSLEQARQRLAGLEAELVFNLFEGFFGCPESEADIAELLSQMGMVFTGSDSKTLRLAVDKAQTSHLLKAHGILTPAFYLLNGHGMNGFHLNFPCIIKPLAEDASHGLSERSVVYDHASLAETIEIFERAYPGQGMVEEFIEGREFNVTIMGDGGKYEALAISEIEYNLPSGYPALLTFAAKWHPDSLYYKGTRVSCPAEVSGSLRSLIEETAIETYELTGCRDYARVDMRFSADGKLYVIDVNPNPDISPGAGAARQAAAAGLSYTQFIGRILDFAAQRKGLNS